MKCPETKKVLKQLAQMHVQCFQSAEKNLFLELCVEVGDRGGRRNRLPEKVNEFPVRMWSS